MTGLWVGSKWTKSLLFIALQYSLWFPWLEKQNKNGLLVKFEWFKVGKRVKLQAEPGLRWEANHTVVSPNPQ